ncbi:chitobiase/beta-hexosaminidase C-terminal domain-containing protein [Brevibacillus sp. SAFN-007a]|uniref:chitobiase/beta-hexosaminidase C-terminal domain-containing protein n=1 Tax=Brevibacillus sp. SAFN-007a TaxID=3436862 RepID=UPI003F814DE6
MQSQKRSWRCLAKLALSAAVVASAVLPSGWEPQAKAQQAGHVVISEVYGGGGNNGAHYKNDFMELYNPTGTPVSLAGWSVQYASANGTAWSKTDLTGSIAPYGYYLIQQAAGSGGTTGLPPADAEGAIPMGNAAGKVALVSSGTILTGADVSARPDVVDLVGFGAANGYEGAGPAPTTSAATSASRKSRADGIVPNGGNGWDTDNNSADFVVGEPTPKNTQSPAEPPPTDSDVSEKPSGRELLFDHTNPAEAVIRGQVRPHVTIKVYANPPAGSETPLAEQVSNDSGQVELTFAHPTAAAVYLTATESGKQESESIELLPAEASPVVTAEKISLQQAGSAAELKGQAGAAAGKAILRAYDAPAGNSLLLNGNLTGSAGENGAFSYTLQGIEQVEAVYVTQQLASEHGKMFESEPVPIAKSVSSAMPIAEARALAPGTTASVAGIVTAIFEAGGQNNVYLQDETAGLVLRGPGLAANIAVGDNIRATGKRNDYYGLEQLEVAADDVTVVEKQAGVPTPRLVTSEHFAAHAGEAIEGQLVTVRNVTVQSVQNGNYTLQDEQGRFLSRPPVTLPLEPGTTYARITGVVNYDFNEYKLVPRTLADLVEDETRVPTVTAYPPGPLVAAGTKVTLSTSMADANIYYTTDGSEPTRDSTVYIEPIQLDADTTIQAFAVKEGFTDSKVASFRYTIQKESVRIHDIQGASHQSPLENGTVKAVKGIVTAVVKNSGTVQGFYMQDPLPDDDPNTSEGIYVYEPKAAVQPGDEVSVDGTVKEYVPQNRASTDLTQTQIDAATITVEKKALPLPDPVVLGKGSYRYPKGIIDNDGLGTFDPEEDAIDFWESLEGMLVQVDNPVVVGEANVFTNPASVEFVVMDDQAHRGQPRTPAGGVVLAADDFHPERITVADKLVPILAHPKVGDKITEPLAGIIDYSFANYKLYPIETVSVQSGSSKPTVTTLAPQDDELTIASYNIENFSAKTDSKKIARIAETIVENMKAPDIIGVVEMQDNSGPTDDGETNAAKSADALRKAIQQKNGPAYRYIDIAPENNQDGGQLGGNIRVGFFYNPARVQLAEGVAGTATEAVQVETRDGAAYLSHNPGRVAPNNEAFASSRKPLAAQFIFQGKPVFVIANHFNSKGGDGALFGKQQPPELVSEKQRMKIARVLNGFVKQIHAADPKANVVVLGDLNDFPFSHPVRALADGVLTNMVEKLPPGSQYTYVYQGNSQVLDQILVSNHLENRTKVDIVHINAGFTEDEGRVSDHDPVLVQIHLQERAEHETTAQEVADGITSLAQPTVGATRLRLPEVPAGFTVAIKQSSDTGVIALDGTITPPSRRTDVELILQVTRESDQTSATTEKLVVQVPAKPTTPPPPVTPPDATPTPDRQKEADKQAEQAILSAKDERSIEEQVQRVLASLEKLLAAKQVNQAEKWDAVSHSVSTVLAAAVKQAEREVVRKTSLHDWSERYLDEAFAPLANGQEADEELARRGLAVLTTFAKTALKPLDPEDISRDVAKRVRLLAETLLIQAGTLAVEPGAELKATDGHVGDVLDTLDDFLEAIEDVREKIDFSPVLFIRIEGEEAEEDGADADTAGRLRSQKSGQADQRITVEQKLVQLLKKKEIGVRLTVPSGAWVEVPGAYFAKERAQKFALSLTAAKATGDKGVSHPGEAYLLEAWSNGKALSSLGQAGFTLALPLSSDAGEKLQVYTYRNKQWRVVTGAKGKPLQVAQEADLAVFTVHSAATYVVGDADVKALEARPKSLKLAPGEEAQLEVRAIFADGASQDVTKAEGIEFASSLPEQIEVDEAGRVSVLADVETGVRATISIRYAGKTAKVHLFVKSAAK